MNGERYADHGLVLPPAGDFGQQRQQPDADEREFTAAEALGLIGVGTEGSAAVNAVHGEDVYGEEDVGSGEEIEEVDEDEDDDLSLEERADSGDEGQDGHDRKAVSHGDRNGEKETEDGKGKNESDGGGNQEEEEEVSFEPLFRKPTPLLAALYSEYSAAEERCQASQEDLSAARRALEEAKRNLAVAESEVVRRKTDLREVRERVWEGELVEPCRWNDRLEELRSFRTEHGHVDVPYEDHRNKKGNKWYKLTLFAGRVRRAHSSGTLQKHPHRVRALEELGFEWKRVQWKTQNNEKIEKLRKFREQHGHCRVTRRDHGESFYRLMIGLRNQLADYKEGRKRRYVSSLTESQAEQLEEMFKDVDWGQASRSRATPVAFEDRVKQLADHRKKTGHCVPPDIKLKRWINKIRVIHKGWVAEKEGGSNTDSEKPQKVPKLCSKVKMTDEQVRLLDEAGFCWKGCKCPGAPPVSERMNAEACMVPASVRQKEQAEKAAEKARAKAQERAAKMANPNRKLGMWDGIHRWDRGMKMLRVHKRTYGNCCGIRSLPSQPLSHPINYLYKFLLDARRDASALREGKVPKSRLKLTPDRLKELEQVLDGDIVLGEMGLTRLPPRPKVHQWYIERFKAHKEKTGHCNVDNQQVRRWIAAAREVRKKQMSGKVVTSERNFYFSPDQMEKLSSAGLCLDGPCSCPTAATENPRVRQLQFYDNQLHQLRLYKMSNGHTKPSGMNPDLAKFMREVVQDGLERRGKGLKAKTPVMEEWLTKEKVLLLRDVFCQEKLPNGHVGRQKGQDTSEPGLTCSSRVKDCAAESVDCRLARIRGEALQRLRASLDKKETCKVDTKQDSGGNQGASYTSGQKRTRKEEEEISEGSGNTPNDTV